jgi:glycine cleavage system H protein
MVPEELKYTKEHEWVKLEGDTATIGITDHAQSELGDITFVELPNTGLSLKKGDSAATIESVKAANDIYAPISGEVLEVNESLNDAPETINSSPYQEGWMYKLKISDPAEVEALLGASGYEDLLKG